MDRDYCMGVSREVARCVVTIRLGPPWFNADVLTMSAAQIMTTNEEHKRNVMLETTPGRVPKRLEAVNEGGSCDA